MSSDPITPPTIRPSILLARITLLPNIQQIIYTVPPTIGYQKCDLFINSLSNDGIIFSLALTTNTTPSLVDYIFKYLTPVLDSSGNPLNSIVANELFIKSGENVIIETTQSNLVFRLVGYPQYLYAAE